MTGNSSSKRPLEASSPSAERAFKRPLEASSPSGERASKRPSYDHESIIAVLAGPDEHRFAVYKDVICAKSKFFRAACSTRWLKDGERVVRLPDVEPEHFRVYVDWSYTGKLVVEDDATKPDRGMNLASMYLAGEFLDDVELRNNVVRLLNTLVVAQGFLRPRAVCLILENTATSSLLRKWAVDTAFLVLSRSYFTRVAKWYPSDFMSAMAVKALQHISPVAHLDRERNFTCLLPNYLQSEGETSETAT